MDKYWIWFSRINKIGAKTQNMLLEKYKTPEKIWNLRKNELAKILTEEQLKIISCKKYRDNLELYEKYMENNNIQMITINDNDYPEKLKNIYDKPVVLYALGNIKCLNNASLAVIGSRMCSEYGKYIANRFSYNISKHNINIISGLAKGIDTYAHIGAIKAEKPTVAVIGCGLDKIYPKENYEIYNKIIKTGGVIISEYIVGTKPEKINFPARNRIISGLSNTVLVVEAARKEWFTNNSRFCFRTGENDLCYPTEI